MISHLDQGLFKELCCIGSVILLPLNIYISYEKHSVHNTLNKIAKREQLVFFVDMAFEGTNINKALCAALQRIV